jgi:hypothetical protein
VIPAAHWGQTKKLSLLHASRGFLKAREDAAALPELYRTKLNYVEGNLCFEYIGLIQIKLFLLSGDSIKFTLDHDYIGETILWLLRNPMTCFNLSEAGAANKIKLNRPLTSASVMWFPLTGGLLEKEPCARTSFPFGASQFFIYVTVLPLC